IARLEKVSKTYADSSTLQNIQPEQLEALNAILYQSEQQLLTSDGLPRRPWYRHTIYSPGYYTGYGVKTLPGVREAIEQRNWEEAREQIRVVSEALGSFASRIEDAIKMTGK